MRVIEKSFRRARDWVKRSSAAFRETGWRVGVALAPIERFLELGFVPEVHWIPNPEAAYLADPFGIISEHGIEILCERLGRRSNRGAICQYRYGRVSGAFDFVASSGWQPDLHYSYPYIIHDQGRHFCVPETCRANQVRLYEYSPSLSRWAFVAVLLHGIPAVDSTPFKFDGLWWLAAGRHDRRPSTELWLWYAHDLVGPWRPHQRNPVKIDASSSRPGGTPFWHGGKFYRPAQDCSEIYGKAVVLNQVTKLSPDDFGEDTVALFGAPSAWPWCRGVHTLSAAGEFTLLDAHFVTKAPAGALPKLARQMKRVKKWARDYSSAAPTRSANG